MVFGILFFTFHGLAKFASVVFNDHFRSSDFIRAASSFGRLFLSRQPYLLQQSIEVFPLKEAIVVHRMANGGNLLSVDPITKRVWRNSQILSRLGYTEEIR